MRRALALVLALWTAAQPAAPAFAETVRVAAPGASASSLPVLLLPGVVSGPFAAGTPAAGGSLTGVSLAGSPLRYGTPPSARAIAGVVSAEARPGWVAALESAPAFARVGEAAPQDLAALEDSGGAPWATFDPAEPGTVVSPTPAQSRAGAAVRSGLRALGRLPQFGADAVAVPAGEPSASGGREAGAGPERLFHSLTPPEQPAPPVPTPAPERRAVVRRMLLGVALFKFGMESLAVAVPLLAMETFKSVTSVALFVAVWGISQAVSSASVGGLFRRAAPQRIMATAMAVQAVAVAGLLGLLTLGAFTPAFVLPLYAVAGAAQGVVETAKRSLPPVLLGPDAARLEDLNSKTHMAYELAGVAGAFAAAAAIAKVGLGLALAVHPVMYGLAAFVIRGIPLPAPAQPPAVGAAEGAGKPFGDRLMAWWRDYRTALATLWRNPAIRGIAFALLVAQVIHRLMENIVYPVYAKQVLEDPSQAGVILGSSNFGELVGAVALIKLATVKSSAARPWVRGMALLTIGFWLFSVSPLWWAVLPFVMLQAMTWAVSDLKLTSVLQARPEIQARELGVLFSSCLVVVTVLSFGVGLLIDAAGAAAGIVVVNAALTVAAMWLFRTWRAGSAAPASAERSEREDAALPPEAGGAAHGALASKLPGT